MMASLFPFWAPFPLLNLTFLSFFPYSLCLFPLFHLLLSSAHLLLCSSLSLSLPLPGTAIFIDAFELLHSLGATLQFSFIVS